MMAQEVKKVKLDPSKVNGRVGYRAIKRGFDVLASGLALILLSPLFLILFVLIKREDGGPAFYSQERIGKNERPFKMWKFCSSNCSTILSALTIIERNFHILNGFSFLPIRSCE